jgi:hypothetical protein
MAIISIGGAAMPSPSSMKIPQFDLDSGDTGRNETGVIQRDRVRQGIYKIECEWKGITSSDLNMIENAVKPASFSVAFPTSVGSQTKTMYVGDRNIEIAVYSEDYHKIRWNISFNLIEY